jgi:CysZ protein
VITQLTTAFDSYLEAVRLLNKHRMWPLVLASGLIYLLLITVGIFGVYAGMHSIVDWVLDFSWIKKSQDIIALKWLIKVLMIGVYVAAFFFYFSLFKFILLAVASPLYGYISERTEAVLTGKEYAFSLAQLSRDIVRGVTLSIRNLLKQTFLTIVLLLLSFIPVVGLISAALIILLDAYYYGFAMIDYCCERKQMSAKESAHFVSQHKGLAIGNGLVFYVLFLIPVIGVVIGAPLSAIAATISMHNLKKL